MSIENTVGTGFWANNSVADLNIIGLRTPFWSSFVMQSHPNVQPSTPARIASLNASVSPEIKMASFSRDHLIRNPHPVYQFIVKKSYTFRPLQYGFLHLAIQTDFITWIGINDRIKTERAFHKRLCLINSKTFFPAETRVTDNLLDT